MLTQLINMDERQKNITSSSSLPSSSTRQEGGGGGNGEQKAQERLQMIDTMKAPIIEMGRNLGYEVIENYDLGGGPIHVTWVFKPGSESLPDMRLGFICIPEEKEEDISTPQAQFSLNEAIARAMINLIDKLVLVVPSEMMTKKISDSIESMPDRSILQLRKYVTVLTPSTLVSKNGIKGAREKDSSKQTGEIV
jgi:hypothetical protein